MTIAEKISLWNEYQLNKKTQDLIVALSNRDDAPSSERLANELNRSPQVIGRTLKNLTQKGAQGLVENVSLHRGRFAWKLTTEGSTVAEIIKGIKE